VLTGSFIFQLTAFAEKIQRMISDPEIEDFPHHRLDLLNTGIAEFKHMFAILADEVIMLAERKGFFKTRSIFSELMTGQKLTVEQQFDRIIDRCPADTVTFCFHVKKKRFNIKMIIEIIHFRQDVVTFIGLAMTVTLQVFSKDLFDGFVDGHLNCGFFWIAEFGFLGFRNPDLGIRI
jgi:hypothetical protein